MIIHFNSPAPYSPVTAHQDRTRRASEARQARRDWAQPAGGGLPLRRWITRFQLLLSNGRTTVHLLGVTIHDYSEGGRVRRQRFHYSASSRILKISLHRAQPWPGSV